MDQGEDPRDLERKIEQASRIASRVNDPTTYQRLTAWVEELKQRLQKRRAARRSKEEIRTRAHELWEEHVNRLAGMRSSGYRRNRKTKRARRTKEKGENDKEPEPSFIRDDAPYAEISPPDAPLAIALWHAHSLAARLGAWLPRRYRNGLRHDFGRDHRGQ